MPESRSLPRLSAADVLRAARKRIEDPMQWTQGRLRDGERRCAAGALAEVCGGRDLHDVPAEVKAAFKGPDFYIGEYNDQHTHAEVLAMFDRAIAEAEKADG